MIQNFVLIKNIYTLEDPRILFETLWKNGVSLSFGAGYNNKAWKKCEPFFSQKFKEVSPLF